MRAWCFLANCGVAVVVITGISAARCSSVSESATSQPRKLNTAIQAQVERIRAARPAKAVLRYYTADNTGPKPDGSEVSIGSAKELTTVLTTLHNSDHGVADGPPSGMGKDNMITIEFYNKNDDRIETIYIMASQIDGSWGPSVKALALRYMPKTMTFTADHGIVPK
jgi:hypothetical protein